MHAPARTLLTALAAALSITTTAPAAASNYLIVIADDLGVDKIRSYAADYPGYEASEQFLPQTDTIDSLADAGVRFTRSWANPVCSPTRASFHTGVHPYRHGIGTALSPGDPGLDPSAFTMLAQAFSDNGYETGYFGKWHVGMEDENGDAIPLDPANSPVTAAPHPARLGWDRFFGALEGAVGDYFDWTRLSWFDSGIGFIGTETVHATTRTTVAARNWINARDPAADWLAVVAYHAPHARTATNTWDHDDVLPERVLSADLGCLDETDPSFPCADPDRAAYQALVEHLDIAVDVLLNGIDPAVLDDTVIIFFGDNGTPVEVQEWDFETTPSHGKGTAYEWGVRVPMIVADGLTWRTQLAGEIENPGRSVDAGVHVFDVYQTLMEHAALPAVAGVDSRSFLDCLDDNGRYCGWQRRYGYAETYRNNGGPGGAKSAVRFGNDKLVAVYDFPGACMEETFFNTLSDPFETTPRSWPDPNRSQRLRDHFTSLHGADPASWAHGLTFCP